MNPIICGGRRGRKAGTRAGVDMRRHSGIEGYAGSRVIVVLAGAGLEVVHFASDGTAVVSDRGPYSVPTNPYGNPTHANRSPSIGYDGISNSFNKYGRIIHLDDFEEQPLGKFGEERFPGLRASGNTLPILEAINLTAPVTLPARPA